MYGQCPTGAGYQKIETKNDTSQKTDNVVGESKDRKPKSFKEMLQNVKEKTSTGNNFSNMLPISFCNIRELFFLSYTTTNRRQNVFFFNLSKLINKYRHNILNESDQMDQNFS